MRRRNQQESEEGEEGNIPTDDEYYSMTSRTSINLELRHIKQSQRYLIDEMKKKEASLQRIIYCNSCFLSIIIMILITYNIVIGIIVLHLLNNEKQIVTNSL